MNTHTPDRQALATAWTAERRAAATALRNNDTAAAWAHLERAHILSQPMAGRHVRTHVAMLAFAVRTRRAHEVFGQLFRIVVAASNDDLSTSGGESAVLAGSPLAGYALELGASGLGILHGGGFSQARRTLAGS